MMVGLLLEGDSASVVKYPSIWALTLQSPDWKPFSFAATMSMLVRRVVVVAKKVPRKTIKWKWQNCVVFEEVFEGGIRSHSCNIFFFFFACSIPLRRVHPTSSLGCRCGSFSVMPKHRQDARARLYQRCLIALNQ